MKRRFVIVAVILVVLGLVFLTYLRPESQVVLANLWALCS